MNEELLKVWERLADVLQHLGGIDACKRIQPVRIHLEALQHRVLLSSEGSEQEAV